MELKHCKTITATAILMLFGIGVVGITNSPAQQGRFMLQGKEYIEVEEKWFTFSVGKKGDEIAPQRLVVRLKNKGRLENLDFRHLNISGVSLASRRFLDGFYVLTLNSDVNPFITASALEASGLFEVLEFDAYGKRLGTPNDQQYATQWNMPKIQMPNAWDITIGNASIILGIVDSGVKHTHEDLDGNIWVDPLEDRNGNGNADFTPHSQGGDLDGLDNDGNGYIDDLIGWDFGDNDNNPDDVNGHGTAVAGIQSAQTNNFENGAYVGVAGVAGGWGLQKGAALMVLKDGQSFALYSLTAQAIEYAAINGARVINISEGFEIDYPVMKSAIDLAINNYGVVVVAAAGNRFDPEDPMTYPAKYPDVIAVAATDQNDNLYSGNTSGPEMDLLAPHDVPTTRVNGGYYSIFGGTSAASPHVAGLAALIRSINPNLTWQQSRDILRNSADKLPGMNGQNFTEQHGYGRANAYQALLLTYAYSNKSMSANATAGNNGRRLAKDGSGKYHLVFESGTSSGKPEIFYRNSTDGTNWSAPVRLSNGQPDGAKTNPSIYARGTHLFVAWQKNTGSSHDITFHKSTDAGATWPGSNRKVLASSVGSNPPLPVISSPGDGLLMVVYRTATNLSYRTSADNGVTWLVAAAVPSSGAAGNSPSLAATTSNGGYPRTALVNAATGGNGAIFYRYFIHEPDSTGWTSLLKSLSQIVPGSYTGHKNPSLAPSGDASSKVLHVAWEATHNSGAEVVVHRQATNWVSWPTNTYTIIIYYQGLKLPSITGLASAPSETAELLFQNTSQSSIFRMHYDNAYWNSVFSLATGFNPSASIGNTTAKYVWTSNSAAPYQIQISAETLSKASDKKLAINYHRSIAIIDTAAGKWLEVRLDKLAVKTKSGEEITIPFAEAKVDDNTLTPTNAFANLASSSIRLPADAESLFVHYQVNGEGLSAIKKRDNDINIEMAWSIKNGATSRRSVINTSAEGLPQTKHTIALAAANLAGKEISLRTQVSGLDNKPALIASLGHIYEVVKTPVGKVLSSIAGNAAPQDYALAAYPNPFSANGTFGNSFTQIHFAMKETGRVAVRVYNLNGQLVRELLNEPRTAGEHTVPWDGQDHRGLAAASGVYFIRFEAGHEVKLSKVMLVR